MTATWTSLHTAGLTYGDEFTYHGQTKAKFQPAGVRVRIERREGAAYHLVNAKTGAWVSQATSLKTAKWWIA